jgi:superfamily I DNA and/or RNA helicase
VLDDIHSDDFLDLLPLWVGTLDEVERMLPSVAALFDLVILDEASQIDQLRAVSALCRAERAMVVGDAGVDDPVTRRLLDVRRNSLFDVAAAAGPIVMLDEHVRSVPHLIDFSSNTFYGGALRLMTQHPNTEGLDAISQVQVSGDRTDGVNQA